MESETYREAIDICRARLSDLAKKDTIGIKLTLIDYPLDIK